MSEKELVLSVEELCHRRTVKKVVGQQSHEADNQSFVVPISDMPKEVNDVTAGVNNHENVKNIPAGSSSTTEQGRWRKKKSKPKIQKVPKLLQGRKNDKDFNYFVPRVVSIGPIHHRNEKLEEESKNELAAKFIGESKKAAQDLFDSIKNKIAHLKTKFNEQVLKDYDDDTLSLMLVVDGCFILQFIKMYSKPEDDDSEIANINSGQVALIKQDLFLLENQIPYEVLETLMESTPSSKVDNNEEMKKSVKKFIQMNVMSPSKYSENIKIDLDNKPLHLLDLLRSALLQGRAEGHRDPDPEYTRTFRNLQDVKAAGVMVEPSNSCSLRDVSFSSFCFNGYLKLPPLIIDDSTKRNFFNLVAYEMCPDNFSTGRGVTCCLYFLNSLIDNGEDAKDMRMANIFRNRLNNDDDVAKFFNDIGTELVPSPAYVDVKKKIQNHCDSKLTVWVAQAYRDHFSSPWFVLALIATLIVLALTGVQTWFTINPR
ncbi:UPF0481 protein At3g47200-like [Humulus lupulus]|uniref:UPF0481 protein At3g47200-like n=1 Tax=Humulus lupulus TaxID=3486 RepID=UPI002B409526|nr:UPF0481 protein At3g47200-like [Humulus lupulus]